jgi:5-methylthioadenosine/S-adenosylhomocysteine deaminase
MSVAWNMGIPWQETDTKDLEPLGFRKCIEMATINGARALGLEAVTGSLTPGKRADLVVIDASGLNVAPVVDLESTIVRSATPANIDTVMIDGRILKRHGELLAFDVARVIREAEESAHEVRARAGGRLQLEP